LFDKKLFIIIIILSSLAIPPDWNALQRRTRRWKMSERPRFRDSDFTKSSWSKNNPKTCVMVAKKSGIVAVRDSKDARKRTLLFSNDEWSAFVRGVKGGEFDPSS